MLGEFFDSDAFLNRAEREIVRSERMITALQKERLTATHNEPKDGLDPPEASASAEPTTAAEPTVQPDPLL